MTATVARSSAGARPVRALTLDASPQTVLSLGSSGHEATVDQLAALADTPTIHQFASAPYVPVNAAGLVGAGLGSELALQVARGAQVLAAYLPELLATPATAPDGGPGHLVHRRRARRRRPGPAAGRRLPPGGGPRGQRARLSGERLDG